MDPFPLDSYATIAQQFHALIDAAAFSVDEMAPELDRAAEVIARAMLADHRLFCCAVSIDAGLATTVAEIFATGAGEERPALPGLALTGEREERLLRRLRAVLQEGDVLLWLDSAPPPARAQQLRNLAESRRATAVLLAPPGAGEAGEPLIAIRSSSGDRSCLQPLLLAAAHVLVRFTEQHLFNVGGDA